MKRFIPKCDGYANSKYNFVNDSHDSKRGGNILVSFRKGERVLVITECSKKKLGYILSLRLQLSRCIKVDFSRLLKIIVRKWGSTT
jgi:hypothetical protein